MHLVIQRRTFWPGSRWEPVPSHRPIKLPLDGGELRVAISSGESALVKSLNHGYGLAVQAPCDLTIRPTKEPELIFEVISDDGNAQRFTVITGFGRGLSPESLADLADFHERLNAWLMKTGATAAELYHALSRGNLTLLTRTNPLSGMSTQYPFEKLLGGCPSLLEISEHPRLHLHIEEEVRPVSVVRRSGPAAIKHLSSHSEHWEARTLTGLRPARLLAEVLEDDWSLYENRFVVTFFRKLRRFLRSSWEQINGRLQQAESSINFYSISEFAREQQPKALSYLLPDVQKDDIEESYLFLAELYEQLSKLLKVVEVLRRSRLYQRLHDCRDIVPPILNTNILAMDRHYRRVREMWDVLVDYTKDLQVGPDDTPPGNLAPAFAAFCQVLTMAALDVSGFSPADPSLPLADRNRSSFEICGDYKRRHWSISPRLHCATDAMPWVRITWKRGVVTKVPFRSPWHPTPIRVADRYEITASGITFYDRLTISEIEELRRLPLGTSRSFHRHEWASFLFEANQSAASACSAAVGLIPILSEISTSGRYVDEATADLLDRLAQFGAEQGLRSTYALLPVAFSESRRDGLEPAGNVARRLLNYGDRYAATEARRWGSFRAGIIPISRDQFPSLSRIAQLINYQTTRFSLEHGFSADECPLCGQNAFGEEDGVFQCHIETCQCVWLFADCSHCHNRFPVIKRNIRTERKTAGAESSFLEMMLSSEEVSDPRTGAAPQPLFCTNTINDGPRVICPHCGLCSDSGSCPRSCIYSHVAIRENLSDGNQSFVRIP
jgi:hypothetical protein